MNLIDEMLSVLGPQARIKGVELGSEIGDEMPTSLVGPVQHLQDILINLVDNAIKFTKEGRVLISFRRRDSNHWSMAVSDTGPGISTEAQGQIFEPFVQVDGSITREHGGIGLGLAIVKRLSRLADGQITVESEVGQGSTFTVQLPLNPSREDYG